MKKVRMIGALGAVPALGVLTPVAAGAGLQHANAPGNGTKTVSLDHHKVAVNVPNVCGFSASQSAKSGLFTGKVFYRANLACDSILLTTGVLHKSQTGLEMRTRIYNNGVQVGRTHYVHGTIYPLRGITSFSQHLAASSGTMACEALVNSANLKVLYGPVCEKGL